MCKHISVPRGYTIDSELKRGYSLFGIDPCVHCFCVYLKHHFFVDSLIANSANKAQGGHHHNKQLLQVVADFCGFIMHEVINIRGKFNQRISKDPKYIGLHESSTVPPLIAFVENRGDMYAMCTLMMLYNDICIYYFYIIYFYMHNYLNL